MSQYTPPATYGYHPPSHEAETVRQLSLPIYQARGWLKFLGILSIIGGIFQVLTIAGIISGGLSIWMGSLLTQAGSSLGRAGQMGDRYAFITSMESLKTYFVIQGVLTLLSILFVVLALCVLIVLPMFGVIPMLFDPEMFFGY